MYYLIVYGYIECTYLLNIHLYYVHIRLPLYMSFRRYIHFKYLAYIVTRTGKSTNMAHHLILFVLHLPPSSININTVTQNKLKVLLCTSELVFNHTILLHKIVLHILILSSQESQDLLTRFKREWQ